MRINGALEESGVYGFKDFIKSLIIGAAGGLGVFSAIKIRAWIAANVTPFGVFATVTTVLITACVIAAEYNEKFGYRT